MLFLINCESIMPLVRLIKFGVIPLIQGIIIFALIILLIMDIAKAVIAGKEDEMKSAQKMAIKRVVYAVIVFLVPMIVNLAFGLLDDAGGNYSADSQTWLSCYSNAKK